MAALLPGCGAGESSPFTVTLTLSPAAKAEMRTTGEGLNLSTIYYWRPDAGGPSHDEDEGGYVIGGYPVGFEEHQVSWETGQVEFAGRLRASRRVKPGEGVMRMLLTVTSARQKSRNNILSCNNFDDPIVEATDGVRVHCELTKERW